MRLYVGVMSGTSCDGVDAVAVALHDAPSDMPSGVEAHEVVGAEVLAHHHAPYEGAFRERLLAIGSATAVELALLHVELGRRFGEAARRAMEIAELAPDQFAAVASAGHTAAHVPPGPDGPGATLSLGDGDVLAVVVGRPVVSDFRARDRAAGGQGAPLVPWADACLLRAPGRVRAALNLGGIGNLTVVPPTGPPLAFDTGPGNMLLDGALARATEGQLVFDEGGALGAAGHVDQDWLGEALAADAFLGRPPPKSTGREDYGEPFLDRHWPHLSALSLADLAATLAAYTVESVVRALADHVPQPPDEVAVSGGGAFNRCLMDGLARRLAPVCVVDSQQALGIPVLAREAVSFAILADATLRGIPSNVPGVTGARAAVLLGKLSFGPERDVPWNP